MPQFSWGVCARDLSRFFFLLVKTVLLDLQYHLVQQEVFAKSIESPGAATTRKSRQANDIETGMWDLQSRSWISGEAVIQRVSRLAPW